MTEIRLSDANNGFIDELKLAFITIHLLQSSSVGNISWVHNWPNLYNFLLATMALENQKFWCKRERKYRRGNNVRWSSTLRVTRLMLTQPSLIVGNSEWHIQCNQDTGLDFSTEGGRRCRMMRCRGKRTRGNMATQSRRAGGWPGGGRDLKSS